MHRLFISFFLIVAILLPTSSPRAELIDRIVAIVNDDIITFSDLNREGAALFRRITQEAPPEQVEMALLQAREEMLSSLIDKMIVEQRAEKMGVSVSEEEIDRAVARMIARNDTTPEKFFQQLQMMGSSEQDYRSLIKNQMLQQKLVEYEIRSRVVITEEKMKEYYEQHYAQKLESGAYHILQMGFAWQDESEGAKEKARSLAESVREKAVSGQDFRALARQHSELPSAVDGGDIGIFKKDEMASYMKKAIVTMQPGQISPVVETPSGYQFFKLLSDHGDVRLQASYESVKDEIEQKLQREAMTSHFEKWVKELRDQAYIKKML